MGGRDCAFHRVSGSPGCCCHATETAAAEKREIIRLHFLQLSDHSSNGSGGDMAKTTAGENTGATR